MYISLISGSLVVIGAVKNEALRMPCAIRSSNMMVLAYSAPCCTGLTVVDQPCQSESSSSVIVFWEAVSPISISAAGPDSPGKLFDVTGLRPCIVHY